VKENSETSSKNTVFVHIVDSNIRGVMILLTLTVMDFRYILKLSLRDGTILEEHIFKLDPIAGVTCLS